MRGLSVEQIVLLIVLIGLPLLRAAAARLRRGRIEAAQSAPEPLTFESAPSFWEPAPPERPPAELASPPRPRSQAQVRAAAVEVRPALPWAVRALRGDRASLRRAMVLSVVLGRPRADEWQPGGETR